MVEGVWCARCASPARDQKRVPSHAFCHAHTLQEKISKGRGGGGREKHKSNTERKTKTKITKLTTIHSEKMARKRMLNKKLAF